MPALKAYRASLHGQHISGQSDGKVDRASAESVLMRASNAYIEKSAMFAEDEAAIVNLLHLGQLGTASFWLDMTSNVRSTFQVCWHWCGRHLQLKGCAPMRLAQVHWCCDFMIPLSRLRALIECHD